jgi:hypothetical protein
MRIQQSQVALEAERVAYSYSRTEQSLQASFGSGDRQVQIGHSQVIETEQLEIESYRALGRLRTAAGNGPANAQGKPPEHANSRLLRAPEFRPLVLAAPPPAPTPKPPPAGTEPVPGEDGDLLLLKLLIELLSGHEIEVAHVQAAPATTTQPLAQAAPPAQFSIDYSFSAYHYEMEQTSFHASGTVQTAEGAEISFDFALEMSRSFESFTAFDFHAGTRKDPLVLGEGASAPQLSSARHGFDLDGDGMLEQVALPTGASAFLALDLDGNGRIDNGLELFGAQNGDGFAQLARHDADGNGFIDAADPVFGQLLAWRRTESGEDRLDRLATLGIGALYLASAATPFELRGPGNESLGAVRRTGVYLNEDGSSGALQQLDLVV